MDWDEIYDALYTGKRWPGPPGEDREWLAWLPSGRFALVAYLDGNPEAVRPSRPSGASVDGCYLSTDDALRWLSRNGYAAPHTEQESPGEDQALLVDGEEAVATGFLAAVLKVLVDNGWSSQEFVLAAAAVVYSGLREDDTPQFVPGQAVAKAGTALEIPDLDAKVKKLLETVGR